MKVVCGAKVPRERNFHGTKVLGTFAPEERKFHGSESSMERKFHGSESSLYGLLAPWNESAEERKGQLPEAGGGIPCRPVERSGELLVVQISASLN